MSAHGGHFIYIALALRRVGTTFHTPAIHAAIPTFVPTEHLMKAGGWGSFINSGSNILGPLIGAFLMEILPASLFAACLFCTFIMGHTAAWFNVPFNVYVQESTEERIWER